MSGHLEPITDTPLPAPFFQADYVLLNVQGMTTGECAACVRNSLLSLDGVYSVDAYPNREMVQVCFDSRKVSARGLMDGLPCSHCDGRYRFCAQLLVHEVHTYLKGVASQ